jgi:hypothetical protein
MKILQSIAVLVTALSLTSLSARALTETDVTTGSGGPSVETAYDGNISASDLLTGATITTNGVAADLGSYNGINDGAAQPGNDVSNSLYFGHNLAGSNLDLGPVATFTLNTSVNTLGYTLTSVNSIYGWQNFESVVDQDYTISYSTVTDPTFTLLASVIYAPFDPATENSNGDPNDHAATQVTLTDLGNITGVNAIQIAFNAYTTPGNVEQNGQMIREIDVFGTPTAVPEPSTWALMGFGGLLLAWRLRRNLSVL